MSEQEVVNYCPICLRRGSERPNTGGSYMEPRLTKRPRAKQQNCLCSRRHSGATHCHWRPRHRSGIGCGVGAETSTIWASIAQRTAAPGPKIPLLPHRITPRHHKGYSLCRKERPAQHQYTVEQPAMGDRQLDGECSPSAKGRGAQEDLSLRNGGPKQQPCASCVI